MTNTKKVCRECGAAFEPDKFHPYQVYCTKPCKWKWHRKHRDPEERRRKRYFKYRLEALEVLGNECAICRISDPHLLNIDHINGKENDKFKKANITFLRWIVKNPKEAKERYQVLCWNHNMLKFQYPEEYKKLQRGGQVLEMPPGSYTNHFS